MLNPIFKSLSELNISFLPNALASRNYLKAFLKCLLTIFKRISKVIPSQASVLFFILFNFQGPCCLSRQPLYYNTTFHLVKNFFKSFLRFYFVVSLHPFGVSVFYIIHAFFLFASVFLQFFYVCLKFIVLHTNRGTVLNISVKRCKKTGACAPVRILRNHIFYIFCCFN